MIMLTTSFHDHPTQLIKIIKHGDYQVSECLINLPVHCKIAKALITSPQRPFGGKVKCKVEGAAKKTVPRFIFIQRYCIG